MDCLSLSWQTELRLERADLIPQQNDDVQEKKGETRSPAAPLQLSRESIRLCNSALEHAGATQAPAAILIVGAEQNLELGFSQCFE